MTLGPEPPAVTPSLQRLRSKAKHEIGEIDDLIPEQIAAIRTVLSGTATNYTFFLFFEK